MEEKIALTEMTLEVIGIVLSALTIITTIVTYLRSEEKKK